MTDSLTATPVVARHADLSRDNTLALACRAAARLDVCDLATLRAALDWSASAGLAPLPLGEGSNVLLPARLRRAVIRNTDERLEELDRDGDRVLLRVGGGWNWHRLVATCVRRGWYGLENLALIPGTVGAAPVQNIGAYGVELAAFVDRVHGASLPDGRSLTLSNDACAFAYRDSVFKGELRDRCMILSLELRLSLKPTPCLDYPALARRLEQSAAVPTPAAVFDAVVALRRERLPDPSRLPNAGSFFKNPVVGADAALQLREAYPELPAHPVREGQVKLSAAWMIERCGLRGLEVGGVAVAAQHALVLVNRGGGREALLGLAARVRNEVRGRFGCTLEIEPQVIDDE